MRRDLPVPMVACVGAASAVLVGALSIIGIRYGQGAFDPTYPLSAVFPTSAQGVFTDGATDVKMRGVSVGSVSSVELLPDGQARITLAIDSDTRVPDSVTARLEPLSVFGPKFVSLDPSEGDSGNGPFLESGSTIAVAETGTDLTDVLDGATELFGAVDPVELVEIFQAISTGVSGLGDEMAGIIDNGTELLSIADRNRTELERFLPDLRTVASTTASRSDSLLRSVDDVRTIAALLAERGDDLNSLFATAALVAERMTALFGDAADEIDLTIRAIAAVVEGIYGERELVPKALDTVGAFFEMLGAGMRLPGPDGKKLTALKGFIVTDLCLVYGVCLLPDGGVSISEAPSLTGTGPSGPGEADRMGITDFASVLLDPAGAR